MRLTKHSRLKTFLPVKSTPAPSDNSGGGGQVPQSMSGAPDPFSFPTPPKPLKKPPDPPEPPGGGGGDDDDDENWDPDDPNNWEEGNGWYRDEYGISCCEEDGAEENACWQRQFMIY